MLLAQGPPVFHWRTLRESGGSGGRRRRSRQPGTRDGDEGAEGEDTKWADGDKKFEDEGGAGVQHQQTKG